MSVIFLFIKFYNCANENKRKLLNVSEDSECLSISKKLKNDSEFDNIADTFSVNEFFSFDDYLINEPNELYDVDKFLNNEEVTSFFNENDSLINNEDANDTNLLVSPLSTNTLNDNKLFTSDKDQQSISNESDTGQTTENSILNIIIVQSDEVADNLSYESVYNNLSRKFKNFSFAKTRSLELKSSFFKELGVSMIKIINDAEEESLFRFNSIMKQIKSLTFNSSNLMPFYNNPNYKTKMIEFIDQIKNPNFDVFKNLFSKIITYTCLKSYRLLNFLEDSFKKFMAYQYDQIGIFLEGSNFAYNYKLFRKPTKVNQMKNSSFFGFLFRKAFDHPKICFIHLLFPELNDLISIFESKSILLHVCKKAFFVLEYIFFKSLIIRNDLKNELAYLSQDGSNVEYQKLETLYKYILDVRSLLYISFEALDNLNCSINPIQSKIHLMRTFFDFIKVVAPSALDFFTVDEFFFTKHTFKDISEFKTKNYYLESKTSKKMYAIFLFKEFKRNSNFKNLIDFDLKMFEEYISNEITSIMNYYNKKEFTSEEIKNYVNFKKLTYMRKLLEALNKQ